MNLDNFIIDLFTFQPWIDVVETAFMKYLLLLLISAAFLTGYTQLPTFDYSYSFGGDSRGVKILHSPNGGYVVLGEFTGELDLDPSENQFGRTSMGSWDIFISAHSADDSFLWGDSYGGIGFDDLVDARMANDGSIYVLGAFEGSVQWGEDSYSSNGNLDIALAKLNSTGELDWVQTIGGDDLDVVRSMEISDDGNILLWGQFLSMVDFDPSEEGSFTLTSNGEGFGQGDLFLASYSTEGEFQFAKSISSTAFCEAMEIVKMPDNRFLLSGGFNEEIDIDLHPDAEEIRTAGESFDVFLAQVDASGNLLWSGQLEGSDEAENDNARCINHSISVSDQGEIYLSGAFDHTMDFDPGPGVFEVTEEEPGTDFFPGDGFLMKLNANLDFEWMRYINGYLLGSNTELDNNGNVLMSGVFHGLDVDLNTHQGAEQLVSTGEFIYADFNSLLISLNPNGDFLEGGMIGGENLRTGINGVSIAPNGQFLMTGDFSLTVDFDFSEEGIFELTAQDDLQDAFVLSLNGDPLGLSALSGLSERKILAFPNPAVDFFSLPLDRTTLDEVRLTDLRERLVKHWRQAQGEYPIGELLNGAYILSWKGGDRSGNQVLIKN